MRTVWKYELSVKDGKQVHEIPRMASLMSIQRQGETIAMWFFVDTEQSKVSRAFCVYGTGHEIDHGYTVPLATVQFLESGLVWHVFEVDL